MAVNHEDLTANHVPHAFTYADAATRLAATGFVAGDVNKLAKQTDGRRPLYRLTATTPAWDALVPTGKNVVFVDPKGEGDYALLSDALDAISDAAADNQYTIIVHGVVEETDQVVGKSYVHVQGWAGASIQITPASAKSGIYLNNITKSVWRDLDIQCLGANALQAVEIQACDPTVKLDRCTTSTDHGGSLAIEVVSGDVTIELSKGVPQANWIADAQGAFGTSRDGEARTWAAMLIGETSGAVTAELLTLQGDRLVLPNLSAWAFDGWIVGRDGAGLSRTGMYHVVGGIRREATANTTTLVGTPAKTVLGEDVAAYDVAVTADTTNGSLKVEVTGDTGDDVQWVCTLVITQVLVVVV